MKKTTIAFATLFTLLLVGCGDNAPMTEQDMAAQYGLTMEEFQEQKEAAARMNMSVEDHLKHSQSDMDHEAMPMDME